MGGPPSVEIKIVTLRAIGGEVGAASTLAPKVGPLGLSPKKIGEDIQKNTMDYKGLKVTVKLIIQNRQAKVEVVPSASTLVIQALKEPIRDRKKGPKNIEHDGNITLEDVIGIAKIHEAPIDGAQDGGHRQGILGTCHSVGCTVDEEHPQDIMAKIDEGRSRSPKSKSRALALLCHIIKKIERPSPRANKKKCV